MGLIAALECNLYVYMLLNILMAFDLSILVQGRLLLETKVIHQELLIFFFRFYFFFVKKGLFLGENVFIGNEFV